MPSARDLGLGALAGVGGAIGVGFLYHGLAIGRMAVIAPVTAVGAAVLPLLFGLATGERPGRSALTGVVVALLAVVAVSSVPASSGSGRRGLGAAVLAGIGFGAFFIVLSRVGADAGLWPLAAARSSVGVVGLGALLTRTPLRAARPATPDRRRRGR